MLRKSALGRPHHDTSHYTDSAPAVASPNWVHRHRMGLFTEFWLYVRQRKVWWITPIFVLLLGLSVFIIAAESSAVLPFIYALF